MCVCVCADQHAVWIKSRQKVGAFFFSGLDVAPHHIASAAAVCDIVGQSHAESLNLAITISPIKLFFLQHRKRGMGGFAGQKVEVTG